MTAKGVISRHHPAGSNAFLQQYDDLKATASRVRGQTPAPLFLLRHRCAFLFSPQNKNGRAFDRICAAVFALLIFFQILFGLDVKIYIILTLFCLRISSCSCPIIRVSVAKELDPLVYVLGKVVENPEMADMLTTASTAAVAAAAAPAPAPSGAGPASIATITDEEMSKLRSDLAAATSTKSRGSAKNKSAAGGSSTGVGSGASSVVDFGGGGGGGARGSRRTASSAVSQVTARGNPTGNVPVLPGWAASRPMLTPDFPALER